MAKYPILFAMLLLPVAETASWYRLSSRSVHADPAMPPRGPAGGNYTRVMTAMPLAGKASSTLLKNTVAAFRRISSLRSKSPGMPAVAWRAFEALAEAKKKLLEEGAVAGAHSASASVFENVQIALPLTPPIIRHDPARGQGQGDKNIVGLEVLPKGNHPCIVYGIGIANDPSFEEKMASLGCETHAFDCTVNEKNDDVNGKKFKFHQWCIGSRDSVSFKGNIYAAGMNQSAMQFKSMEETMTELGHKYVDILKFDIEGFEWKLFENEILPARYLPEQLSFELHTQKASPNFVPHENVADKDFVAVNKLFLSLFQLGYRVASKEVNNGDPACAEFVLVNVNLDK